MLPSYVTHSRPGSGGPVMPRAALRQLAIASLEEQSAGNQLLSIYVATLLLSVHVFNNCMGGK